MSVDYSRELQIPLKRSGSLLVVQGQVRIGRKRRAGHLVLHTGMGFSVLSPDFVEDMGRRIDSLEQKKMRMPYRRQAVPRRVLTTEFIHMGEVERPGHQVVINPFRDSDFYIGILGLDFLAGFDFEMRRDVLVLKERGARP
jgi:hypothetical protein